MRAAGTYLRNAAGVGYLDGGYASYETGGTTGPIYTIGGSYYPTSTSLNTMYGIGYANQFTGGLSGATWGLYVAAGGTVRIYLDAENGIGYASNSFRAPIFYDSNNTGYYVDPASGSYLYSLVLSGAAYFRPNNWIQLDGDYGIYNASGGGNGAHFLANQSSSYGAWRMIGSRNSWGGIYDTYSAVNGMMYDGSGNGGVYREANGRWYFYYALSNDCMGIGTSSTSSTYSLYLTKGVYAQSRIDATIFYDTNDTGYYIDPNSTSNTALRMRGGALFGPNVTWGAYLAVGGNGNISTSYASVATTNGNLHMDAAAGYQMYLNYYAGSMIYFGNGASGIIGSVSSGGDAVFSGNVTAYGSPSDRRLKQNIQPLQNALATVLQLCGRTFDWVEDSNEFKMVGLQQDTGFIADEVQAVLPQFVREGSDGYLTIRDRGFAALLVEAIKELSAKVDALK